MFLVTGAAAVATALAWVAAGCTASTTNAQPVTGDDAGGSNDSGGVSEDTGTGAGYDAASSVPPVALPFYVSDQFIASGYEGDYNGLTVSQDPTKCKTPRTTGAGGLCYSATWVPKIGDAGSDWTGVYWQAPANNWGSKPGKSITPGATKVTFYAAGAVGGEILQISVGGINVSGATASLPYLDTFTVDAPAITLTTAWTQYTVSLTGATYTSVIGGFCFVTKAITDTSESFYIDDIQWQ
jgi:hypothetical protein